jgi:hypothetical protein
MNETIVISLPWKQQSSNNSGTIVILSELFCNSDSWFKSPVQIEPKTIKQLFATFPLSIMM